MVWPLAPQLLRMILFLHYLSHAMLAHIYFTCRIRSYATARYNRAHRIRLINTFFSCNFFSNSNTLCIWLALVFYVTSVSRSHAIFFAEPIYLCSCTTRIGNADVFFFFFFSFSFASSFSSPHKMKYCHFGAIFLFFALPLTLTKAFAAHINSCTNGSIRCHRKPELFCLFLHCIHKFQTHIQLRFIYPNIWLTQVSSTHTHTCTPAHSLIHPSIHISHGQIENFDFVNFVRVLRVHNSNGATRLSIHQSLANNRNRIFQYDDDFTAGPFHSTI